MSESSESLGQSTDHEGRRSFGVRAFTQSAPFGVAIRGSDDRCLTKGIDLEREPARVDSKRIGSRPAVELRFGPRAAFFMELFIGKDIGPINWQVIYGWGKSVGRVNS